MGSLLNAVAAAAAVAVTNGEASGSFGKVTGGPVVSSSPSMDGDSVLNLKVNGGGAFPVRVGGSELIEGFSAYVG